MSLVSALIQKALAIAQKRAENLDRLKRALQKGEDEKALAIARELCGIAHERTETSHRADSRLH